MITPPAVARLDPLKPEVARVVASLDVSLARGVRTVVTEALHPARNPIASLVIPVTDVARLPACRKHLANMRKSGRWYGGRGGRTQLLLTFVI